MVGRGPQSKQELADRSRLEHTSHGLTDVPLLGRAGVAILVAGGEKARRFAGRPYHVLPTLGEAISAVAAAVP